MPRIWLFKWGNLFFCFEQFEDTISDTRCCDGYFPPFSNILETKRNNKNIRWIVKTAHFSPGVELRHNDSIAVAHIIMSVCQITKFTSLSVGFPLKREISLTPPSLSSACLSLTWTGTL